MSTLEKRVESLESEMQQLRTVLKELVAAKATDDGNQVAKKKSPILCPAHAHCAGPLASTAPSELRFHVHSYAHNIGTSMRQIVPGRQGGVLFAGESCGCNEPKSHFFPIAIGGAEPVMIANCLACGLQVQLPGQPLLDLRGTPLGTKIEIGSATAAVPHEAPMAVAAPPLEAPQAVPVLFSLPALFSPPASPSPPSPSYCPVCPLNDCVCVHRDDYSNLNRGQKRAFQG